MSRIAFEMNLMGGSFNATVKNVQLSLCNTKHILCCWLCLVKSNITPTIILFCFEYTSELCKRKAKKNHNTTALAKGTNKMK